jgi:hypothetical protein
MAGGFANGDFDPSAGTAGSDCRVGPAIQSLTGIRTREFTTDHTNHTDFLFENALLPVESVWWWLNFEWLNMHYLLFPG